MTIRAPVVLKKDFSNSQTPPDNHAIAGRKIVCTIAWTLSKVFFRLICSKICVELECDNV